MIMNTNYLDTVTLYTDYPKSSFSFTTPWKLQPATSNNNPNKQVHAFDSWYCRIGIVNMRYYPDLYGSQRLFITFSVPKLYNGNDNNYYPISNFNFSHLEGLLQPILSGHFDVTKLPNSLKDWSVSRADLFYTRKVPNIDKQDYLDTYSTLSISRYSHLQYKNTTYLMSSLHKYKSSSSVIRIYDKDKEMSNSTQHKSIQYFPYHIESDFEDCILVSQEFLSPTLEDNQPMGNVRIELQMRRPKLRYEYGKKVHLTDLLNQSMQEKILNKHFVRLGLNRLILSQSEFRSHVHQTFKRKQTQNKVIECARLIRNHKQPNNVISKESFNRYDRTLKKDNIHIATSRYKSLSPIDTL